MRVNIAFAWLLIALLSSGFACASDGDATPVALWHFDEGSGNTAYDSSANGNDGFLKGDPQWTTDTPSSTGYALDFDGDGDYVEVPDGASQYGMSVLAIQAWVYPRGYSPSDYETGLVAKWGPGGTSIPQYTFPPSVGSGSAGL